MQKSKYKNLKYCKWLREKPCVICESTYGSCGHHIENRLHDDIQIPLCWNHHTGAEGIHTIGKKTWYSKYLNKEDSLQLSKEWFEKFLTTTKK